MSKSVMVKGTSPPLYVHQSSWGCEPYSFRKLSIREPCHLFFKSAAVFKPLSFSGIWFHTFAALYEFFRTGWSSAFYYIKSCFQLVLCCAHVVVGQLSLSPLHVLRSSHAWPYERRHPCAASSFLRVEAILALLELLLRWFFSSNPIVLSPHSCD